MTAELILNRKGSMVHTVRPNDLVMDAVKSLSRARIGAVVISTDGVHIDGILSERDIVRGLAESGVDSLNFPVNAIMTRKVRTCTAKDRAISIMGMMNEHGIGHVPVVDNDKMIGLISIRDIIKRRLEEVEVDANAMREYIASA